MILIDANVLVYAVLQEAPEHERARRWLDDRLADTPRVGLPWPSLLAFVRLVSSPHVAERPLSPHDGWRIAAAWLDQPSAWIPAPTARHATILGDLLLGESSHRVVPDAHLAALAVEHGLVLCSSDRDFARFEGLRWANPLDDR